MPGVSSGSRLTIQAPLQNSAEQFALPQPDFHGISSGRRFIGQLPIFLQLAIALAILQNRLY